MWQDDDVERAAGAFDPVKDADGILQLRDAGQLRRRQRADGDHELWPEDGQLAVEVRAAAGDLLRVGHAISSALRVAAGKAADHGSDVHAAAERLLIDAEGGKPAKEPSAGGVG